MERSYKSYRNCYTNLIKFAFRLNFNTLPVGIAWKIPKLKLSYRMPGQWYILVDQQWRDGPRIEYRPSISGLSWSPTPASGRSSWPDDFTAVMPLIIRGMAPSKWRTNQRRGEWRPTGRDQLLEKAGQRWRMQETSQGCQPETTE